MVGMTRGTACAVVALLALSACSDGSDGSEETSGKESIPKPHGTLFLPDAKGPKIAGNRSITACGVLPPEVAGRILEVERRTDLIQETLNLPGPAVPRPDEPAECHYTLDSAQVDVFLRATANAEDATKEQPEELEVTEASGAKASASGRVGNYVYSVNYDLGPLARAKDQEHRKRVTALARVVAERARDPKALPSGDFFPKAWGTNPCDLNSQELFEQALAEDPVLTKDTRSASQLGVQRSYAQRPAGFVASCWRWGETVDTETPEANAMVEVERSSDRPTLEMNLLRGEPESGCEPLSGVDAQLALLCPGTPGGAGSVAVVRRGDTGVRIEYSRSWYDGTETIPAQALAQYATEVLDALGS